MAMALPYGELIWRDSSGNTSSTQIKFKAGSTVAAIDASLAGLASILLPLSGCILIAQRIVYKSIELAPGIAVSGSSVKNAGVFIFTDVDDNTTGIIVIPAIGGAYIATSGQCAELCVDTANSSVIAFISSITANDATNPFGVLLDELVAAYKQSRV